MKIILVTLLIMGMAGSGWALTGLPEGGTGVNDQVKSLLSHVKSGQETIRIDDMIFYVETLEKFGFTGDSWPGGLVRYQFDSNVTAPMQDAWRAAAALWSAGANLTFIEDPGEFPLFAHILVIASGSNSSVVGFQGITQEMEIYNWDNIYIIAHEIGHALGFIHEHSRSDRDSYVAIVLDNVEEGKDYNFEIEDSINLTPYDFDSTMHYAAGEFLEPGKTCPPDCCILVLPPNEEWQFLIGQVDHISFYDIVGMGIIYGPSCHGPLFVNFFASTMFPEEGSLLYPFRSLTSAADFACAGTDIYIFGGSQPFAPVVIDDQVTLKTYGGPTLIH